MPIQVEWDNDEKRIIRWTFLGRWTKQEFRDTLSKSNEMMNAQEHTISYIIDFSQSEGIPPQIINEARNSIRQTPKNLGHVVVISNGGIIESLDKALQRFSWFSPKVRFVRSGAEARSYLDSL